MMSHDFQPPSPRTNPFASRHTRPGAIPFRFDRNEGGSDEHFQKILAGLRQHRLGLIVGNHGSGKSTLLHGMAESLQAEFPGGKWIQLTGEPDRSPLRRCSSVLANDRAVREVQSTVSAGGVLVVDGAEQLSPWGRFQLRRRAQRAGHACLVTAHRDLRGFHVLHRTQVTAKLIEDLLQELLREHPDAHEKLRQARQGGWSDSLDDVTDVRELWSRLYDVVGLPAEKSESGCSSNRLAALPENCPDH
ncbi:nSTAND1 domain-containing NTPase [Rhodopirellula sp. P2]|uniref:nSTAND1 domain-containing NTPase n=1 Tax=Rhodopirellula sp. P2 TaxID=2127060 RepID=UPI002367A213|nr:ATP-binding protein [Rhodopirellula sp. P2]WDQ16510.1 ATP-binding protein [Rhodopirellula sp. P2]